MTTRTHRLRPLFRAQKRRSVLPWYFDVGGKGLFLLVILGTAVLALMALAQTGRVVTVGYHLKDLDQRKEELLWEKEALLEQLALAQDPAFLSEWALENGMEVLTPDRMTFSPPLAEWPSQIEAATPAPQPVAREP
jgi:hypothetical protein